MAKVNGKSKGNTFERKIANLFSERFKEKTGLEKAFIRNSDSGSYFGGKNQRRATTHDLEKATFGDIVCPSTFNFSVECKHYKTAPSFKSIVEGKVAQWDTWISQAEQDAKNSCKNLMLVVKYNNVDEFVIIRPCDSLKPIMHYKNYDILPLDILLGQPDKYFFE
jgi:hypothetical protein